MSDALTSVLRTKLNVLVIEDEQRFRSFLIDQLAEMDCRTHGAASAERALDTIKQCEPEIVFLDLHLPGIDGMTFLNQLREQYPDLPVVIITGVGSLAAAQSAIRNNVTDFLTKPCHLGEIENALDRARRQLATRRSDFRNDPISGASTDTSEARHPAPMVEIERSAIVEALKRHHGNRTAAATELGISRRTLYNRIEQYKRDGRPIPET